MFCPSCGYKVETTANFCSNCGTRLKAGVPRQNPKSITCAIRSQGEVKGWLGGKWEAWLEAYQYTEQGEVILVASRHITVSIEDRFNGQIYQPLLNETVSELIKLGWQQVAGTLANANDQFSLVFTKEE